MGSDTALIGQTNITDEIYYNYIINDCSYTM